MLSALNELSALAAILPLDGYDQRLLLDAIDKVWMAYDGEK